MSVTLLFSLSSPFCSLKFYYVVITYFKNSLHIYTTLTVCPALLQTQLNVLLSHLNFFTTPGLGTIIISVYRRARGGRFRPCSQEASEGGGTGFQFECPQEPSGPPTVVPLISEELSLVGDETPFLQRKQQKSQGVANWPDGCSRFESTSWAKFCLVPRAATRTPCTASPGASEWPWRVLAQTANRC